MVVRTSLNESASSSRSVSRNLSADEEGTETARLVKQLWKNDNTDARLDVSGAVATSSQLKHSLEHEGHSQDVFRHAKGLETVLDILDESARHLTFDRQNAIELAIKLFAVLAAALRAHRGNQKYFSTHLRAWERLQAWTQSVASGLAAVETKHSSSETLDHLLDGVLQLATDDQSFKLQTIRQEANDETSNTTGETPSNAEAMSNPASLENAQAAVVALQLAFSIPKAYSETAVRLINACSALASSSVRNRAALWRAGAMTKALMKSLSPDGNAELKPALLQLMVNLGEFGLSTLDNVAQLFKHACSSEESRDLLLSLCRRSKSPAFVHFDMSRHGYASIELPCLPRPFPAAAGYTLTAWIRVDEYDVQSHTTLFGAFDASQFCFVLVYLERDSHQLILQTSVRSSRPSVRFKSMRFVPRRWYHLALVHRKAADPRQSPANLFVDGAFVEQVKCAYPEMPQDTNNKSASGSPAPSDSRRTNPVQAFFGTPHDLASKLGKGQVRSAWSLASAQLYATPVTDEFVAVQYGLGPRYKGNYQDCLGPLLTYRASAELNRYNDLLHPDRADKSDIVTATESRGSEVVPESRLLVSISATSIIDLDLLSDEWQLMRQSLDSRALTRCQQLSYKTKGIAINAAVPAINDAILYPSGIGILTGDPVVGVPGSIDNATWCLSGCLPLVISILEAATTRKAFLQSVRIYFECLTDNWRISEAMEKGSGFGLLAVIIREKLGLDTGFSVLARKPAPMLNVEDRENIPLELLRLILESVGYDSGRPEESMIMNPMAYRVLLVDFDTWRRCDVQTQQLYYEQFVHFADHNKHQAFNSKRVVRMRVVRKLIEAMKSEDISASASPYLLEAIRVLIDNTSAGSLYRDLAMFIAWGLQDARAVTPMKPVRTMASAVSFRQRAASWARHIRGSRPNTPGGAQIQPSQPTMSRAELAVRVLELLADILCTREQTTAIRRFYKMVPNRWLLHLLAEPDTRVVELSLQILCRAFAALGSEFKSTFVDKNAGFTTIRSRLKTHWRSSQVWLSAFALLLGQEVSASQLKNTVNTFVLMEALKVGEDTIVVHSETLPTIMAMLETGLRAVVSEDSPAEADTVLLKTVIQLLGELYTRSPNFRTFAIESRYIQDLLFVLYPVLVGSDRLAATTELEAEKDTLSFGGAEVKLRPHSNSLGERPPSVRSLNVEEGKRTPSPMSAKRIQGPKRLSSFILVNPNRNQHAHFNPALAPKTAQPIKINVGNDIVELVLELAIGLFIDLVCNRERFQGIGLFLKVPPGFREHQAYFESYILVNTLSQLWNTLQLNPSFLVESRVLTNLSRYSQHLAEAVFEGWFIDGAQPVLDFTGRVLEHLLQPDIARHKNVRLCSQYVSQIRVVFLRVILWRLSELDDDAYEDEAVAFIDKVNYWQTILFSTEDRESRFIRLICFLLYLKLMSTSTPVRLAAARLWRTILVQKPVESGTLLTDVIGAEDRHLSTGFMKLASEDEEEWIKWVDENKDVLDHGFIGSLSRPWSEFVATEDKTNEETAKARLSKRREKLRLWHVEETEYDDFVHRYEVSTNHWRANAHAQERLKLQRAMQDHQENVNHLLTVFNRLKLLVRSPAGLEPADGKPTWQLDETEALHRMRLRTVQDLSGQTLSVQPKRKGSGLQPKLQLNTGVVTNFSDNVLSSFPATPTPLEAPDSHEGPDMTASSQLLEGGFEMIDDPKEDEDGTVEDKNRKIMTSLQRGDMVQQLYNISRIVGLEACEGLLVIGKTCLYLQDGYFQRSDGEIISASQAPDDERDPYVQLISGKDVGSQQTKHGRGDSESRHWTWSEVLSISKRRFLFRDVSVEVFFTDGRSYLITCISSKVRDELYNGITTRAPHVHNVASVNPEDAWRLDTLRNPEEGPQTLGTRFATVFNNTPSLAATKKWAKGEMSNFQYLMLINTLAGRTFNDLTQYPVFPWVLADYTSEELNLNDPKTFRNLSKPMGCQTPAREAEYRERYKQFAEMAEANAPPFHYGTHYSSAMIVTSYLIRLQPFVASYLLLQGGSFDHADRLFDSIGKAWLSASRDTMSDVRELTPEFYCLPEFLTNVNGYDFGAKQGEGGVVNDVQLPPWAKGDPQVFISKHREALESPYVSVSLHKWIDLVFGCKQRGEAAVEATNVFNHLSYQGAKDLDTIDDPVERLAAIGIIHSFGQTPHQVFQRPHPAREVGRSAVSRLDTLAESLVRLPDTLFNSDERVASLTFSPLLGRLLCAGPCRLDLLGHPDRFMQWGFADNSLRFFSSNTKRLLGLYENTHVGSISAAVFADSKTLITGGADCTVGVWGVTASRDLIEIQPKTYLFGHRTSVTLLAASRVFSTLLSASADGQVILWGINRLNCIRVIASAGEPQVQAAAISNVTGHIVLCRGAEILVYTLNGHLLVQQKICDAQSDTMTCCAFYEGAGNEWQERELVLTGHPRGVANVWALTVLDDGKWHLLLVKRLDHADVKRGDGRGQAARITAILPMPLAVYTGDEAGAVYEWDCIQRQSSVISVRGR